MVDSNDHYMVISTDGHVGPRIEEYRDYCPHRYLSVFDEQVHEVRASRRDVTGMPDFQATLRASGGFTLDDRVVAAYERAARVEGAWDRAVRLRDMDAAGVAGEVIFHGHTNCEPLPLVGEGSLHSQEQLKERFLAGVHSQEQLKEHEYDVPGCRIYNRWLADFVSDSEGRQAGLAQVPIRDVASAVKEVEWAREAGLRGINFPAPRLDLPRFYDHTLDPLYDVCAQLDMPLTTHAGRGEKWDYGDGRLNQVLGYVEGPFLWRRGAWQLIFSGVFERFPRLKLVLTEQRAYWISELVRDMDTAYLHPSNPTRRDMIPRLPSEYWAANCYVGASFMAHEEALAFPSRGTQQMMWGSDYPHAESTHPYTRLALQATFHDIPPEYVADMVGLTAAQVYSFDVERLRGIADSIGPTVSELSQWSGERPAPPEYYGHAFRRNVHWPALSLEQEALRV